MMLFFTEDDKRILLKYLKVFELLLKDVQPKK